MTQEYYEYNGNLNNSFRETEEKFLKMFGLKAFRSCLVFQEAEIYNEKNFIVGYIIKTDKEGIKFLISTNGLRMELFQKTDGIFHGVIRNHINEEETEIDYTYNTNSGFHSLLDQTSGMRLALSEEFIIISNDNKSEIFILDSDLNSKKEELDLLKSVIKHFNGLVPAFFTTARVDRNSKKPIIEKIKQLF